MFLPQMQFLSALFSSREKKKKDEKKSRPDLICENFCSTVGDAQKSCCLGSATVN